MVPSRGPLLGQGPRALRGVRVGLLPGHVRPRLRELGAQHRTVPAPQSGHGRLDGGGRLGSDAGGDLADAQAQFAGRDDFAHQAGRQRLAGGARPLPDQLTRLCTALIRRRPPAGLPSGWHSVLNAADRTDGPRVHADIGTALPAADGISIRLDALASWPDSWDLYLQATPSWWTYSTDRKHKRYAVPVSAEDDRGGLYMSSFGGSIGRPGYEQVKLTFQPRLDPGASLLTLTLTTQTQQITAKVPLAP